MKKRNEKIVGATSSRPHFEGKTQTGITLIALIITIIVMLILVGVTVNVALNGGLFDTAKDAASKTEMAQIRERAEMVKVVLIADAQTDNTIRLSKQEYRDRLLQEFEGSTADGYKVIVDERYVINIQNIDLDISVTDINKQENGNAINPKDLTTLTYKINDVENADSDAINVDLTITKANMTLDEYVAIKMKEYNNHSERTQEEKDKLALQYAMLDIYGIEKEAETLDDVVVHVVNESYETKYTTIEECIADETVQTEWGTTINQLYHCIAYCDAPSNGNELTEREALDYLYTTLYNEEQNTKEEEYTTEYNNYTTIMRLYVSKDGGEEIALGNAPFSIKSNDKVLSYEILENGTYEFILKTKVIDGSKEEILREKIEIKDI